MYRPAANPGLRARMATDPGRQFTHEPVEIHVSRSAARFFLHLPDWLHAICPLPLAHCPCLCPSPLPFPIADICGWREALPASWMCVRSSIVIQLHVNMTTEPQTMRRPSAMLRFPPLLLPHPFPEIVRWLGGYYRIRTEHSYWRAVWGKTLVCTVCMYRLGWGKWLYPCIQLYGEISMMVPVANWWSWECAIRYCTALLFWFHLDRQVETAWQYVSMTELSIHCARSAV